MIKKLIFAVLLALPFCASAQKFGVVDPQAILPQMPEYTTAETQLSDTQKKYETELGKLQEELEKKFAEYQALPADTPDAIKERRMQEIQEQDQRVQQFVQTAQQDIQRQQQQLMQPLQEKLMKAITTVGQNNGFLMIFPAGVAAYQSADVVDITPLVKTELGI